MNLDLLYEKWDEVECFSDGECIDCPNHTECRRLILNIRLVQSENEMCNTFDGLKNLLEEV
jgi:hypothetical protein